MFSRLQTLLVIPLVILCVTCVKLQAAESHCDTPYLVVCTINEVAIQAHNDDLIAIDSLYSAGRFQDAQQALQYFRGEQTPMIDIALGHARALEGNDVIDEIDVVYAHYQKVAERALREQTLKNARDRFIAIRMISDMFPNNIEIKSELENSLNQYHYLYSTSAANSSIREIALFHGLTSTDAGGARLFPINTDDRTVVLDAPYLPIFFATREFTSKMRSTNLSEVERQWIQNGIATRQPETFIEFIQGQYQSNRRAIIIEGVINDELSNLLDIGEALGFAEVIMIKLASPAYSAEHCHLMSVIEARGFTEADFELNAMRTGALAKILEMRRLDLCEPVTNSM